jgi:hypothetical protein
MPDSPEPDPTLRVEAAPAKRFFVSMLVKDIELIPAIMDLVDNSIDGAKRLRGEPSESRYHDLHVDLSVRADGFRIADNCGGMDIEQARQYAFRFGRIDDSDRPIGEVGQFGVGMKRALFKLGSAFTVESTAEESHFVLPVNVPHWVEDTQPDWTFEFSVAESPVETEPSQRGTAIDVSPLHDWVVEEFRSKKFIARLEAEIELRHMVPLQQGLTIRLNETELTPAELLLLDGDDFHPLVKERTVPANGANLDMLLYAGLVHLADEDDDDTDDPDRFRAGNPAGWYLFCNDRLLIARDKSRLTGWGEAAAAYHPQYRQFRGYVFLSGDSKYMPWTTTKTSVDEDSSVFRIVQTEMFDGLQKAITVMNRLKSERQSKALNARPAVAAMKEASGRPLAELQGSARFDIPPPPPRMPSTIKWIRYSVEREDFDKVAEELGTTIPGDVGRSTFEHFLNTQVAD